MPEPTPTPANTQTLAQQIAAEILAGESGTAPRPLESYSGTELRQLWRAGRISPEEWHAELVARGDSAQSANDEIARQKNIGVSTAASTRGQLTASEAAAVSSLKTSAPSPPAPVANAAASATAGAQAGGNAQFEGGGVEGATGTAAGQAGGTAQPGGAQALSAPQQGGGGEPAKPKPVKWVTFADGTKGWGREAYRDANGIFYERTAPPPYAHQDASPVKDKPEYWEFDETVRKYRKWEWDSETESWQPTATVKDLPQTIPATEAGQALATGKPTGAEGQPLNVAGGDVPAPTEGFETFAAGSGQTNIYDVADAAMIPKRLTGFGEAQPVGVLGAPRVDGNVGQAYIGTTSGGVMETRGPEGGFGLSTKALLDTYGWKVTNDPLKDAESAAALLDKIEELEAAGMSQQDIQDTLNPYASNVRKENEIEQRKREEAGLTGPTRSSRSEGARIEGQIAAANQAVLSGSDTLPTEFDKGGKMTLPEPVFIIGRSGKVYATAGEKGGGTEDMRMMDKSLKFIPRHGVKRMQEGGLVDFDLPAAEPGYEFASAQQYGFNDSGEYIRNQPGRDVGIDVPPPPPLPGQEYVGGPGGETVAEANRRSRATQEEAARQQEEDRALAGQLQEEINAAAEERQQGTLGYRYGVAGLPPPSVLELPANAQGLTDRRGRPLLTIPLGVRVRYESALAAARRKAQQEAAATRGAESSSLNQILAALMSGALPASSNPHGARG